MAFCMLVPVEQWEAWLRGQARVELRFLSAVPAQLVEQPQTPMPVKISDDLIQEPQIDIEFLYGCYSFAYGNHQCFAPVDFDSLETLKGLHDINGLNMPLYQFLSSRDLVIEPAIIVVGSPANHDPNNDRFQGESQSKNVLFKDVCTSLGWHTPADCLVRMTFSKSARQDMQWWTTENDTRKFLVTAAWFQTYQPGLGLADTASQTARGKTSRFMWLPPTAISQPIWISQPKKSRPVVLLHKDKHYKWLCPPTETEVEKHWLRECAGTTLALKGSAERSSQNCFGC